MLLGPLSQISIHFLVLLSVTIKTNKKLITFFMASGGGGTNNSSKVPPNLSSTLGLFKYEIAKAPTPIRVPPTTTAVAFFHILDFDAKFFVVSGLCQDDTLQEKRLRDNNLHCQNDSKIFFGTQAPKYCTKKTSNCKDFTIFSVANFQVSILDLG
jgi:hypothetical protein